MGDYVLLDRQAEYLEWLITPSWERDPAVATMPKWAKSKDLNPETVRRWKRDPRFRMELDTRLRDLNVSAERTQEVINSVFRSAVEGDTKAAALYLQYIGQFMPTKKLITEEATPAQLGDLELAQELEAMAKSIRGSDG